MKSIVIAAPMSGSGKTTITLGLLECLKRRGLVVAPFKVGPDFIDPGWHKLATGRPSINLDGWMCTEHFVRDTFARHARGADITVIEGAMGLFDGIDGDSEAGSTAQIARFVNAPVILVVDAKSQARSAAALVRGFAGFDPRVRVAGVIFNNVGSENHARILRQAMASSLPEIRVLGCIPRDERMHIPSRHLGLVTAAENPIHEDFLGHLAGVVEKYVDMNSLLSSAELGCQTYTFDIRLVKSVGLTPIAVARDEAFCFVYEDNLRLLREAGAEICEFSPMRDSALPEGIGGIYLPGGYPELYAEHLASNEAMKTAIREAVEKDMPVYAECGGFIYLTRGQASATDINGVKRGNSTRLLEFAGIFPVTTRMLPRRKALGYRQVELLADSPIARKGSVARGHEFHYSEMEAMPEWVERVYMISRKENVLGSEGFRYRNCLASYVHLHFGSCPEIAATFVGNSREFITGPLKAKPLR